MSPTAPPALPRVRVGTRPGTGRRTRATAALLAALAVATLAACAPTPDDGKVHALASFYPLQFVVARVGGDLVTVHSLTPPGAEPHDLELAPAQLRAVGTADLVVYLEHLQPSVDEAVEARHPHRVVAAGAVVGLHAPDAAAGADPETTVQDEAGQALDPHFWLDPTLVAALAVPVEDALADADPAHAGVFRANRKALVADLTALDGRMAAGLTGCARDEVVVSHAAFGYLADRYHLRQVAISGLSPDAEPTPARIRQIRDVVRADGVTTIFTEELLSPKASELLAADLGITTAVLDPVEAQADPAADYLAVMDANLAKLRTALGCA